MRRDFSPSVMELVPSPYFWFSAKPASVLERDWNVTLSAPHVGHCQSGGRSCAANAARCRL